MRIFTRVVTAATIAFLVAGSAFADAEPKQGYLSVMGSYIDDDTSRGVQDGVKGGRFGFGYAFTDLANIEGYVQLLRSRATSAAGPTRSLQASGLTCSAYSAAPNASAPTCMPASATLTSTRWVRAATVVVFSAGAASCSTYSIRTLPCVASSVVK